MRLGWALRSPCLAGRRETLDLLQLLILKNLEVLGAQVLDVLPFLVGGHQIHEDKIGLSSYDLRGSDRRLVRSAWRSSALRAGEKQPRSQNCKQSRYEDVKTRSYASTHVPPPSVVQR